MNREARRVEQLLGSLSKEKRAELEPTLKGKKSKEKIKMILEEKKRLEGGERVAKKQEGVSSRPKEKDGGKNEVKGKSDKPSKRAAK
jgi:hypothetical protein